MITNYTTYINESFLISKNLKLYIFLKKHFSKYLKDTDFILVKYKEYYEIRHKLNTEDDYFFPTNIRISISYNNRYEIYYNNKCQTFKTIEDLKKYLNLEFNDIYYKNILHLFKVITDCKLQYVIILDRTKYSEFIYELITNNKIDNKKILSQSSIYYKYLTEEYKNKINHLINANNFDLI